MKDSFNVLVIDDNADLCETLALCLSKLGCDVSTAGNAETGMEKLQRFQYDAVFASLCLHNLGGMGIARWVRKNRINDTKIFITTSWNGEFERELLRFEGIQDVIKKPFNFSEVRDKVVEHLG